MVFCCLWIKFFLENYNILYYNYNILHKNYIQNIKYLCKNHLRSELAMDYLAKDIRNVCLMGHKGYGKTTLTEALLYYSKATDRLGKVEQGNTVSDFDPEEVKRKLSISLTVNPFTYKNTKINLIDTPGFYDFEGEQNSALSAVDTAIIVITSKTTVSVGTEAGAENRYCRENIRSASTD